MLWSNYCNWDYVCRGTNMYSFGLDYYNNYSKKYIRVGKLL